MTSEVRCIDEGVVYDDNLARVVTLVPAAPFDADVALTLVFETGATDSFDRVSPLKDRLDRVVALDDKPFLISVEAAASGYDAPGLRVTVRAADGAPAPDDRTMDLATTWTTRRFTLDTDMAAVRAVLGTNAQGAFLLERCWPLRPPGLADPWSCLLTSIISSRIYPGLSTRLQTALATTYGLTATFGGAEHALYPSVEQLAAVTPGDLLDLKFSRQKASYLPAIAQDMQAKPERYDWDRLRALPGAEAVAILRELHGVGPWTASYVALRGLKHPDVFIDEGGLRRIVAPDVANPDDLTAEEMVERTAVYAPYRSFACHYAYMVRFGSAREAEDLPEAPPAPTKKPR